MKGEKRESNRDDVKGEQERKRKERKVFFSIFCFATQKLFQVLKEQFFCKTKVFRLSTCKNRREKNSKENYRAFQSAPDRFFRISDFWIALWNLFECALRDSKRQRRVKKHITPRDSRIFSKKRRKVFEVDLFTYTQIGEFIVCDLQLMHQLRNVEVGRCWRTGKLFRRSLQRIYIEISSYA